MLRILSKINILSSLVHLTATYASESDVKLIQNHLLKFYKSLLYFTKVKFFPQYILLKSCVPQFLVFFIYFIYIFLPDCPFLFLGYVYQLHYTRYSFKFHVQWLTYKKDHTVPYRTSSSSPGPISQSHFPLSFKFALLDTSLPYIFN